MSLHRSKGVSRIVLHPKPGGQRTPSQNHICPWLPPQSVPCVSDKEEMVMIQESCFIFGSSYWGTGKMVF